jgi:hypothetical protein
VWTAADVTAISLGRLLFHDCLCTTSSLLLPHHEVLTGVLDGPGASRGSAACSKGRRDMAPCMHKLQH